MRYFRTDIDCYMCVSADYEDISPEWVELTEQEYTEALAALEAEMNEIRLEAN